MKTIPRPADDPRYRKVADRLAELQTEHAQLETRLSSLRRSADTAKDFARKAEDLATGIEPDEPAESREDAIQRTRNRLDLVEAAISAQRRKLAEVRQAVSEEILAGLRPQYTKHISDVAAKVEALCASLAKHDEFVNVVQAAGLPSCDHLPAGGIWRRPRVLSDFGVTIAQENSIAREFFAVLESAGYGPVKVSKEADNLELAEPYPE
jgi:small-conductance mechanosensitive channel